MRMLIAAALLTAPPAAGGEDAAAEVCADLHLAIAAARADPPFSTLPPRILQQGHMLFRIAWPCMVEAQPPALRCRQYVTYDRQAEMMAEEVARCLPEARRAPDESSDGDVRGDHLSFPYYRARFRLPGLAIEIARGGNPANHLGQFVTYRIVLIPPR